LVLLLEVVGGRLSLGVSASATADTAGSSSNSEISGTALALDFALVVRFDVLGILFSLYQVFK
jgi:hypothetical protein